MFTLSRILEIDALHHGRATLPGVLGDSWLYAKNPIFRKIRDEFLRIGGGYTDSDAQLCGDYNALSLLCLPELLQSRMLPFCTTTKLLGRLAQQHPDFTVSGLFLAGSLRHNYLLHESSHCIAHAVLAGTGTLGQSNSAGSGGVVDVVIGEAFALTAERTAWSFADTPTHSLFYSLNSYVGTDAAIRSVADEAISKVGMPVVFRLAFYMFFFLTTGTAAPDAATVASFIELATEGQPLPASAQASLKKVCDALQLNFGFRSETTPIYFRLLGLETEFARFAERKLDVERMEALELPEALRALMPCAIDAGQGVGAQSAARA